MPRARDAATIVENWSLTERRFRHLERTVLGRYLLSCHTVKIGYFGWKGDVFFALNPRKVFFFKLGYGHVIRFGWEWGVGDRDINMYDAWECDKGCVFLYIKAWHIWRAGAVHSLRCRIIVFILFSRNIPVSKPEWTKAFSISFRSILPMYLRVTSLKVGQCTDWPSVIEVTLRGILTGSRTQ